ncbi:serine/threonine-protein kinase [Streptomyces sp. NPDC090025]|uniref:serine/threonine-protein kinase n=1 Tax=Streptomyces sp. NPDC090025 TaxID=3365922 RepID=UPI003835F81F
MSPRLGRGGAAELRLIGAGLAEALQTIHRSGLVHRDLKPSNVLVTEDGPRIIDFGISKALEGATALTGTGLVVGTPGFMSPEQALGRPVGAPSDVFSLGAVLAFAARREGPFGVGSVPALLFRVVHDEPVLDGVPEELLGVVRRCLAKDAGARPTADELVAWLGGGGGAEATVTVTVAGWGPEPGAVEPVAPVVTEVSEPPEPPVPPSRVVRPRPRGEVDRGWLTPGRFAAIGGAVLCVGGVLVGLVMSQPWLLLVAFVVGLVLMANGVARSR